MGGDRLFVVRVSKDKKSTVTKSSVNYLRENKAEKLLILFDSKISEYNVTECLIKLHMLNVDETAGDIITINLSEELYNKYYQYSYFIPDEWTSQAGNLKLWFEFIHAPTTAVIKTNIINLPITTHRDSDDEPSELPNIPNDELLLIDTITGTNQVFTFYDDYSIQKVEHTTSEGVTIRTDDFRYETDSIREIRTLGSGEIITIVINTDDFTFETI